MGTFIKRFWQFIVTAVVWAFAAFRIGLDLIGWSTAPDDVGVAVTRADKFLEWMYSLPWWGPLGAAVLLSAWVIWVNRREVALPAVSSPSLLTGPEVVRPAKYKGAAKNPVVSFQWTAPQTDRVRLALKSLITTKDAAITLRFSTRDVASHSFKDFSGHDFVLHMAGSGDAKQKDRATITPVIKAGYPCFLEVEFSGLTDTQAPASFRYKINGTDSTGKHVHIEGYGALAGTNAKVVRFHAELSRLGA
jgi:hypothetical protein